MNSSVTIPLNLPLEGILLVDLSQFLVGPVAGLKLAIYVEALTH